MATATASPAGAVHSPPRHRDARENGRIGRAGQVASDGDSHDPMDLSPTSTSVRPSPSDRGTPSKMENSTEQSSQKVAGQAMGAAAAGQQPKIVQTAFIHKLYNMLEDRKIQHLISWSSSNESFVINPSSEFSKVLAQYFKHTNISSFVRQLNMYGFHKVSDVFSTATPDTPLWEFKHGEGNFKRGDLNGLREIKRRASKHALIHRDSVASVSKPPAQPHTTNHDQPPESAESRITMLEQSLYEMHSRMSKSEESNALMAARCQDLSEKLAVSYQHNLDMSGMLAKIHEDPEHPLRRESQSLQRDIGIQLANIRAADGLFAPDRSPRSGRLPDSSIPASPGQQYYDERRRASIQTVPRQPQLRQIAPSSHRHGSLGGAGTSPTSMRTLVPPPPIFHARTPPSVHAPIPSVSLNSGSFPRRHTSYDIHSHWPQGPSGQAAPGGTSSSPYAPAGPDYTLPHPGSPPIFGGDQQLREKLDSYSFGQSSNRRGSVSHQSSRGASPPPRESQTYEWSLPPPVRMPFRNDVFKPSGINSPGSSAAPTRRSSMANIQAMLNPADTAETEEERLADEGEEMRKRKRRG